jgi:hypothetical protein
MNWQDVAKARQLSRISLPGRDHQPRCLAHMEGFAVNGASGVSFTFGSMA